MSSDTETLLASGTVLKHHSRESCKPPCALHEKIPGPWVSWPLGYQEAPFGVGDMIMVRFCEHGIPHPCVEQFQYWAEQSNDRYAYHQCCGCPCVPSGVLSGALRVPMTPEAVEALVRAHEVQVEVPLSSLLDPDEDEDEGKADHVEPVPAPADPRISIPGLQIPDVSAWRGRLVVPRSLLVSYAKNSSHKPSRESAQKILSAYDAQVAAAAEPVHAPAPVPTPVSASSNPNVVAEAYLKAIQPHIDGMLHKALVLLTGAHAIHAITLSSRRDGDTYLVDSCEQDCNDYFKAGEVATDDDCCVTLKLAILGGYVPEEWSDDE